MNFKTRFLFRIEGVPVRAEREIHAIYSEPTASQKHFHYAVLTFVNNRCIMYLLENELEADEFMDDITSKKKIFWVQKLKRPLII